MLWIRVTTSPIFWVPAARPSTTALVRRASSAAFPVTAAERVACCAISLIEAVSSSAAEATVPTLSEAWVDAAAAAAVCRAASPLLLLIDEDMPCISRAATATASTIWPTLLSNSVASRCIAASRSSLACCSVSPRSAVARASAAVAASASAVFCAVVMNSCCQLIGHPDQHAGFQDEDAGMQHHAAKVGAAREDRRRNDEIQRQMMQGDGNGSGEDRPDVAIGDEARQRREEVHVHVDLPGMARQLVGEHRNPAHQRDRDHQAGRKPVARRAPRQGRRRGKALS